MPNRQRGRVLLVDDDVEVRRALARLLRSRGYEVAIAGDGTAGVEALAAEPWDFVLCDLCMPGCSGLEVAKAATRLDRPPPFRIMTGTPTSDLVPLVRAVVGSPPLRKPVPERLLLDEIERALRRRDHPGPYPGKASSGRPGSPPPSGG